MGDLRSTAAKAQWAALGGGLGVVFCLLAVLIRMAEAGWTGALDAVAEDPVFWIILLLPAVAAIVGYMGGREHNEVRLLAESLEELVQSRTEKLAQTHRAVAERTAEHARWLAGLREGVVCFDAEGRLSDERSLALDRLIPHAPQCDTVDRLLERCGAETETVAIVRQLLWENRDVGATFESTVEMLPQTWSRADEGRTRHVAFSYHPIRSEDGALRQVLMAVEDQTALGEARAGYAEAQARAERLSTAAQDFEAYAGFVDEVAARTEAVEQMRHEPDAKPRMLTTLRTLRYTLGAFAYAEVAEICEQLESAFACGDPTDRIWSALRRTWRRHSQDVARALDLQRERLVPVAPERLVALRQALGRSDLQAAQRAARDLCCHPARRVMARYARYVARRSERVRKQVYWELAPECTDVSYHEVQRIDTALIHLLNNAITHAAVAGSTLTITVAIRRGEDGGLAWTIEDDGVGIDGERLAARAVRMALREPAWVETASAQSKVELCFVDGLSIAPEGANAEAFGVGLSAARACMRALGGDIRVASAPDAGTRFELWIPGQASIDLRRWAELPASTDLGEHRAPPSITS